MAVGETVTTKFTWLLDNVEVVGSVARIGTDDFGIIPDDNYKHLILYMRGNNPLPWEPIGAPGLLHCETYPLDGAGTINRSESWPLPKKPDGEQFKVRLPDGTTRDLQVGDHIRVVGRWVIDHHPEYCSMPADPAVFNPTEPARCRDRGWLRVGQTHVELHPFHWDKLQLVEPLKPGDTASVVVSLAAPLHEEQYLGNWKWAANEAAGVAGKVFLEESSDPGFPNFSKNFHTTVGMRLELDPPPAPAPPPSGAHPVWAEEVMKLGQGMALDQVRTVRQRPDGGIIVEVSIFARRPDGSLGSIDDPAHGRWVFQARYNIRWVGEGFNKNWDEIGHANDVVAMAAINGKLFAATRDNKLWWRDPVGANVNWAQIGHANDVVAMAAINGKLFAATRGNKLWWRDPVGVNVNWDEIGHANDVVAMAAINGKLFAATRDNRLWWRDPVG